MNLFELFPQEDHRAGRAGPACRCCWRMSAASSANPICWRSLQEEILAVIAKHISVDRDAVQIKLDRGSTCLHAGDRR